MVVAEHHEMIQYFVFRPLHPRFRKRIQVRAQRRDRPELDAVRL